MRKVFSSLRLENVEAVAELLRAEGIEVKISDGRSYRGNRRSTFSYRDSEQSGAQPAVWILNADDQPRGRQLLRDAGLLDSSRAGSESSYLPIATLRDSNDLATRRSNMRKRFRIGLLLSIVAVGGLIVYSKREISEAPETTRAPAVAPAPPENAAPAIIPQQAEDLEVYRADVPTALAKLLIEDEIKTAKPAQACIAIDGADPAPQLIQSLTTGATQAFAAGDCPSDATWKISVNNYMTNGSGRGNVQVQAGSGKPQTVEAERDGINWEIVPQR